MELVIKAILGIHVSAGALSLILFWMPVFTKKGNKAHRKTGIWYTYSMGIVVVTAAILCVVNLLAGDINSALFLGFLCFLTGNPLWYGVAILNNKRIIGNKYLLWHRVLNLAIILYGGI